MYTTKEHHKWGKIGFLSSKEPYIDKVTLDRKTLDRRFKGLQFKANPPKSGREGLFTSWSYTSAPPVSYASKRKKMRKETGFGSSDIADRGEFGYQSRQFEWAERIRSEHKASLSRTQSLPKVNKNKKSKQSKTLKKSKKITRTKRFQYDVAFDESDHYKKKRKRPMTADPRQSSYVFFRSAKSVKNLSKSKFARRSLVLNDFYTNNLHLSTPHHVHG